MRSKCFSRWKIVAVAAFVLLAVAGIWFVFVYQSPLRRGLIALDSAYKQERPLEARVTGMSYAPYSVKRGSAAETVDARARDLSRSLLLGGSNDSDPATLHAVGRLYLMQKEFDKAIAQFEEALK